MKAAASDLGKRVLAALVLILAAYILFKVVMGIVAGILWILLVVVAMFAIVWAARILW
jgi:predicted membrane protein